MSEYNVTPNSGRQWRLDPQKTKDFVKGFNEGDPDAGKHTAVILGSAGTGAAIGSLFGPEGTIIGGAVGLTAGVAYLVYEKMTTEKGYKGSR